MQPGLCGKRTAAAPRSILVRLSYALHMLQTSAEPCLHDGARLMRCHARLWLSLQGCLLSPSFASFFFN